MGGVLVKKLIRVWPTSIEREIGVILGRDKKYQSKRQQKQILIKII